MFVSVLSVSYCPQAPAFRNCTGSSTSSGRGGSPALSPGSGGAGSGTSPGGWRGAAWASRRVPEELAGCAVGSGRLKLW